jgi:long-chain acyl-CoA synthetase
MSGSNPHNLIELIQNAITQFGDRPAYTCLGKTISFQELGQQSGALAVWLQSQSLAPDARVAVMLPNILQNPVAITGILRSGMTVVNVNPLYTPRELASQINDAGAQVIVVLENFAHVVQKAHEQFGLPSIQTVVVTQLGDALGAKGHLINWVVRYAKRMVPAWQLPKAWNVLRWKSIMGNRGADNPALQHVQRSRSDLAFLQYTGGTTGVAKGAMLTHGNILANIDQCVSWLSPQDLEKTLPAGRPLTMVCALPLYHIFSLTACLMLGLKSGFCNLLLPNPRDLKATIKTLSHTPVHIFPGVNTLFNALLNHPDISKADFSELKISVGGGMAVTHAVAGRWKTLTGCTLLEGYGLSETSPVVAATPRHLNEFTGSVGLAMPNTEIKILNDEGQPVAAGDSGEIVVRGPQVMQGYWQHSEETAAAFTADGFFKTGDIGRFDEQGYLHILDRIKDMILVSGFNVYPTEIEQVVSELEGVAEVAAVGIPDSECGEVVKLFVVKRQEAAPKEAITKENILQHCAAQLTNYKRPRAIEFRDTLPKTNVGKVLRRALREEH